MTILFTLYRGKEYQYIEMVDYNDTDNNIEACCTNADEQDGTRYFIVYPRYAKNISKHFLCLRDFTVHQVVFKELTIFFNIVFKMI